MAAKRKLTKEQRSIIMRRLVIEARDFCETRARKHKAEVLKPVKKVRMAIAAIQSKAAARGIQKADPELFAPEVFDQNDRLFSELVSIPITLQYTTTEKRKLAQLRHEYEQVRLDYRVVDSRYFVIPGCDINPDTGVYNRNRFALTYIRTAESDDDLVVTDVYKALITAHENLVFAPDGDIDSIINSIAGPLREIINA